MNKIAPDETKIEGHWINADDGIVRSDGNCLRIDWLIEHCLKKLAVDVSGWYVLYQDKRDMRYWELSYLHSGGHGGGPPCLTCLPKTEAEKRYFF